MNIEKIEDRRFWLGACGLFIAVLILAIVQCAGRTPVKNSYDALTALGVTYDTVMSTAADMNRQGLIPDSEWDRIKGYAQKFHDAYHPAVEALKVMKRGADPGADVTELIIEASKIFGQLIESASKYIDEEGRAIL
jgi:hypothetical protein